MLPGLTASVRTVVVLLAVSALVAGGCDSAGTSDPPPEENPDEEDTTAPAAPSGLEGTVAGSVVALDWTAVDADDLAGYNVYRSTAPIDAVEDRRPRNESLVTETSYADSTAEPGTTYHYAVTAVDTATNESGPSPSVQKTPVSPPVDGFSSQPAPIVVDGKGADWSSLDVRQADGGDGDGRTDIERLWMAHTDQRLFLRVTVGQPINLQEDNDLTLYLDTDNDPTTGMQALGLGAEVQWTFGQRTGRIRGQTVGHADIGLTSLPTVWADTFEIALDRSAEFGGRPLFSGDSLRIGLSSRGDRLPDQNGGLGYVLSNPEAGADAPSIDGSGTADARLLSYNVLQGSIFDAGVQPNYRRIFDAIDPDILALQEVSASAAETEQVAEGDLGLPDAWAWAKAGNDLVLGSRYPIQNTHVIPGTENTPSGAFLLDTQASPTGEVIVVNMHPPCCNFEGDGGEPSSNEKRQLIVDGVVAFLREVKQGDGPFGVQSGTPIVVAGDMNFVGNSQQPLTLRTGEIQNTDRFGEPAAPDWDNSSLLDTNPRQTAAPLHTTWINPESSFPPGRLDYVYVTDSAVDVPHEFVLNTRQLSTAALNDTGLRRTDTGAASDHLPLVVDLAFR